MIERAVVGLSGGVDSAAAAYLLKKQGYDVAGVNVLTLEPDTGSGADTGNDAEKAAEQLGIPFYTVDCRDEFSRYVTEPFVMSYLNALTPNPCVACNRYVKWDGLLKFADKMDVKYVATGHYARIVQTERGRYTVQQAAASSKDQTYMLYRLSQEHLRRTLFPLSELTKEEVRRIAGEAGLSAADKKDSQEICFVPDGDYAAYIGAQTGVALPPEGCFVDEAGRVLGSHRGIIHYTVGQRKGLGLALGYPAYVKSIDAKTNTVVIGNETSVMESEISVHSLNFMSIEDLPEGEVLRAGVKIRYRHKAASAAIRRTGSDMLTVSFDESVRAPAPGQSAVFYDDDQRVIGGGVIARMPTER